MYPLGCFLVLFNHHWAQCWDVIICHHWLRKERPSAKPSLHLPFLAPWKCLLPSAGLFDSIGLSPHWTYSRQAEAPIGIPIMPAHRHLNSKETLDESKPRPQHTIFWIILGQKTYKSQRSWGKTATQTSSLRGPGKHGPCGIGYSSSSPLSSWALGCCKDRGGMVNKIAGMHTCLHPK